MDPSSSWSAPSSLSDTRFGTWRNSEPHDQPSGPQDVGSIEGSVFSPKVGVVAGRGEGTGDDARAYLIGDGVDRIDVEAVESTGNGMGVGTGEATGASA